MAKKKTTVETPAGLPEAYTKLLKALADLGEPMPSGDRHPTVTRLREALAQPPRTEVYAHTLAGYIQGLAIVRPSVVDATHVYWRVSGEDYSLMLPDWARNIMKRHEPFVLAEDTA